MRHCDILLIRSFVRRWSQLAGHFEELKVQRMKFFYIFAIKRMDCCFVASQPLPTYGMPVDLRHCYFKISFEKREGHRAHMMFILKTVTDVGRLAICTTASATCWTSNVVSGLISPLGWRAPVASLAAIGVYALPAGGIGYMSFETRGGWGYVPMSICVQLMLNGRPSSAVDLVRPVIACFVDVYATLSGRGVCAEMEPLLTIRPYAEIKESTKHIVRNERPPWGLCNLKIRIASRVHRKGAMRLVFTTAWKDSSVCSSNGTGGAPIPAFYKGVKTAS